MVHAELVSTVIVQSASGSLSGLSSVRTSDAIPL